MSDTPLTQLAALRKQTDRLRVRLSSLEAQRDDLIRLALLSEVPGPQIAGVTGLSKQRVYQIRDGVRYAPVGARR